MEFTPRENVKEKSVRFVVLLLTVLCLAAHSASAQEPASKPACMLCHVKPAESAETDEWIFRQDQWEAGVHSGFDCTFCHAGVDASAFDVIPHRMGDAPPTCMNCHGNAFREIAEEFERSIHSTQLENFTCVQCHSPHYMRSGRAELPREERVLGVNEACIRCHREDVVASSGEDGAMGIAAAHAWDPARDAHARMRCVVCHTPIDRTNIHEVLPTEQALRSCDACHNVDAPVIAEYLDQADPSVWVTNPLVFSVAYVPGATRNRVVDGMLVGLFWLTVGGALVHALLRVLTRRNRPRMSAAVKKVSMYSAWLRIWHWSNAILILLLAYTGVRMHFGQRRGAIMSFETAFNVHNLAGVLLLIVGVLYFVGNYIGRNQRHYLSEPRDGFQGILKQAMWYLFGIFKGEPNPYHVNPEHKFNPLQHVTYAGVMYVMFPLLLLTGLVLLFPDVLPRRVLGQPGVWWVAAIHWILAAAAILFLVGHLYLGSTGDKVRDLYAAMLDGQHRHRKQEP